MHCTQVLNLATLWAGTETPRRPIQLRYQLIVKDLDNVWMAHIQRSRSPSFREAIAYVHTVPPDHSYRRYVPFARYLFLLDAPVDAPQKAF